MSAFELKKEIQAELDSVEDTNQLQAVLTLLRSPFRHDHEPFTDDELKMLNVRSEAYLRGEEKAIPIDELNARLKEKYGFE